MKTAVLLSLPAHMPRLIGGQDYGPLIRQEVVDRWSLCADTVISFNNPEEAGIIVETVTGIECVTVEGPKHIKISAMTEYAHQKNYDVAIIANADCIPIDVKVLRDIVFATQPEDIRTLRRANLNSSHLLASREVFHGIDAFILGGKAIAAIPVSATWRIGDPVWDIWLPMFLLGEKMKLRGTEAYLLAHIEHEQCWNLAEWEAKARKFLTQVPLDRTGFDPRLCALCASQAPHWSKSEIHLIFDAIAEFLFRCETSSHPGNKNFNSLWLQILKAHVGPQDQNFARYAAAVGKPIRRWLLKNYPRLIR